MKKIEWQERLRTGIEEIDGEHQEMFRLINVLVELNATGMDVGSEALSDALAQITEYARFHFRAEEELMDRHDYPKLALHKKQHAHFKLKAANYCVETMHGNTSVPEELLDYLRDWWVAHILGFDMEFKAYLDGRE